MSVSSIFESQDGPFQRLPRGRLRVFGRSADSRQKLALIVLNGATGFAAEEMSFLMKRWKGFRSRSVQMGVQIGCMMRFPATVKGAEIGSCGPDHHERSRFSKE